MWCDLLSEDKISHTQMPWWRFNIFMFQKSNVYRWQLIQSKNKIIFFCFFLYLYIFLPLDLFPENRIATPWKKISFLAWKNIYIIQRRGYHRNYFSFCPSRDIKTFPPVQYLCNHASENVFCEHPRRIYTRLRMSGYS